MGGLQTMAAQWMFESLFEAKLKRSEINPIEPHGPGLASAHGHYLRRCARGDNLPSLQWLAQRKTINLVDQTPQGIQRTLVRLPLKTVAKSAPRLQLAISASISD